MLEEIRKRHSQLHYIHSYIDDNSCDAEWDEASKAIDTLLYHIEEQRKVIDRQHILLDQYEILLGKE